MMTLGEMLISARKKAGYSSADVARATRVMLPSVQALEDDNQNALPAPGYVRGYILSYCRFLGQDPVPYLAQYERQTGHARHDSMGHTPIDSTADRHRKGEHELGLKTVLIIAAIIVFIGIIVWSASGLFKKNDFTPLPVPATTETSTETSQSAAEGTAVEEALALFDFTVKAKKGKASEVVVTVDDVEAFNGVLTGKQKETFKDVTKAELKIKKPKNITVTQNGTNIPIPKGGKLELVAHEE
jgi:cytoskeletal protein RodZ